MADGSLGIKAADTPTDYIDNEDITFGGAPTTRRRQRVRIGGALAADLAGVRDLLLGVASVEVVKGYRAAAATILSTELNSVAAGGRSNPSAAVDNGTNLDRYHDLELTVVFASAPVAGVIVTVHLLPSIDGTTFSGGGSGSAYGDETIVTELNIPHTATTHIRVLRDVPIPPGSFKYALSNGAAVALAATGSTLRYRAH